MPPVSVARRPIVLIVLHQEHSTPGRVGLALKAMGVRLDIRRPSLGEPLPPTLARHDGVVVFGGPMGANDTLEWVKAEIEWLETPLAEDKPLLGLCLGAQMLARALGSRVFSYEDKRSEIGYYPIEPTLAGDLLCLAPFPRTVYQWHSDGFDLPEGAELLAVGGTNFPNQAYRYGRHAVGLQFHPEVTYHMMCRWTHRGAERLTRPGALSRPEHLGGWFQHDGRVAAWLEAFLPAWLEGRLAEFSPKACPASPLDRSPGARGPLVEPADA
ncbi:MAG: glutamine amidotransferase [Hyphomicrobiales bacterium]|nr:glutamine amidotransferase [Hyphomicrobiales bacterium]